MKKFHITWLIQYMPPVTKGETIHAKDMSTAVLIFESNHKEKPLTVVDQDQYHEHVK